MDVDYFHFVTNQNFVTSSIATPTAKISSILSCIEPVLVAGRPQGVCAPLAAPPASVSPLTS